jgi:hypothetical protein
LIKGAEALALGMVARIRDALCRFVQQMVDANEACVFAGVTAVGLSESLLWPPAGPVPVGAFAFRAIESVDLPFAHNYGKLA